MACNETRREQIAAFATGRIEPDAAGELLTHLESCAACSGEFDLAADLVRARPQPAAPVLGWRPALAAAAAAALLITALVWQPWRGGTTVQDLAQLTPIAAPEALLRGEPGGRDDQFVRAMRRYAAGEHAAAARMLRAHIGTNPDDALAHLYLGIALAQSDVGAAVPPLLVAAERGTGLVAERGLWYLANVQLRLERVAAAREALQRLLALDGDYAANAEALLAALADR